jgi:hypothetical protein
VLYCRPFVSISWEFPHDTIRKRAPRLPHKRGRPSKFGRPSRLVAITLPQEVIRGLRKIHPDLAWAIVAQFEKRGPMPSGNPRADAELVDIGERESLIVINREVFKRLPGVNIVRLAADRAFLALEPGCGVGDLEAAVLDRLDSAAAGSLERHALLHFRGQLRGWRRNRAFRFHTRAIIVVERVRPTPRGAVARRARSRERRAQRRAS